MANEFKIKKGLIVTGASGGTVVDIQGSQGQLFSVTDDLSGSIFAVSDISGVPILDVNSSSTVNVDGTLNVNNKVVIQTGTTYAQATDYLYIGGDDLGGGDAAIYLGNRGDGTGYGWRFYYAGIGSGNSNNLVIRSENLNSPVDAVTFNQDGFAAFANKVQAAGWFQGNGATNTLYSNVTAGVLLQTAGSTQNNNDSKIFFRNSGTTVKHTFDTYNGDATFVGQGFSSATSSGDASSTLTTKGYVDGLITGATIYRGAWQAGISATSSAATTASTTLTVTAAILDVDGNTPDLVGAVVTGAGITGIVKVASVTSSTVYVLDTAITATATAYIFSPIYGAPDLSGVTETSGYYYICSEAGSATPNGANSEPNTWNVGDWCIYNDVSGTGQWQKIDNSSVLSGAGTGQTVALWEGPSSVTDSDTLGNAPITVSGNNTTFAGNITALTGAGSGNITVGRNTNEKTIIDVGDQVNSITAYQDSDGNATHNFTLNRVFGGTGANDFIIQKDGTAQFTLDTSANALFAGSVTVDGVLYLENSSTTVQMTGNTSGNFTIDNNSGQISFQANGSTVNSLTISSSLLTLNEVSQVNNTLQTNTAMRDTDTWDGAVLRLNTTNTVDTTGFQGMRFATSTTNNYGWRFGANRSSSGRGSLRFYEHNNTVTGIERFTIQQGGNVGIGTNAPFSLLEISQQLSAAATIDYPYTITSRDDANSINQVGGEGVGIKFRIAGNDATTPGNSLVGASIAAIRESASDTDSSTGLGFFVTQNDETLDEALRIDHDRNIQFNAYGAGTLVTDASGNITVSSGGGAGGPYLPLTGGTLTGNLTVQGKVKADAFFSHQGTYTANSYVNDWQKVYSHNWSTFSFSAFTIKVLAGGNTSNNNLNADVHISYKMQNGQYRVYANIVNYGAEALLAENFKINLSITSAASGSWTIWHKLITSYQTPFYTLIGSGISGTWYSETPVASPTGDDDTWTERIILNSMSVDVDNSGNVGIGTTSPVETLSVPGGSGVMLGFKRFYSDTGTVPAGIGPSYTLTANLNDEQGTTLTSQYQYKFYLTTTGTGTYNSSVYIVYRNSADTVWDVHRVSSTGLTSNHPELTISGNNALIYNDHSSAYGVVYRVETSYTGQAKTSPQIFGADYMWTRDNTDLYYMDGDVGIGVSNPVFKLDVAGAIQTTGSLRITTANPGIIFKETDITDKNWDIQVNNGNLKFYEVNDARSVFNEHVTFGTGGNVGIGFTSPQSAPLATTKLSVNGNTYVAGTLGVGTTDPVTVVDITKVTPSVTTFYPYLQLSQRATVANSKTGISFRNTQYDWDMGHIATERQGSSNSFDMVFYSANTGTYGEGLRIDHIGNIGIGTSTPNAKLDVQGTQGQLFSVTDDLSGSIFAVSDISGVPIFDVNSSGVSYFDGNVGIGTSSPQSKLHIETGSGGTYNPNVNHDDVTIEGSGNIGLQLFSPATTYQYIAFGDPDSVNAGYLRYYHTNNEMVFRTNGSDNMVIDEDGNVGINSTDPGNKLTIVDALGTNFSDAILGLKANVAITASTRTAISLATSTVNNYGVTLNGIRQGSGSGEPRFGINMHNNSTGGIEALSIKSSGNVGIGTIDPGSKLEVDGTINFNASGDRGFICSPGQGTFSLGDIDEVGGGAYITTNSTNIDYYAAGVITGRLEDDGTLTVTGDMVAYGSPSDKRLKENIKPIESALDKAMKLQGVTFDWKENDSILDIKEDIGFIAQDVQKVVPELVRENDNGMLSMRHQGIAPILLEAIKELKAEIEELKKQIK